MIFRGKYTSGGSKARFAGIKAGKTNSLDGDYKGYLKLETSNGSSLVERVRITDEGKVGVGITAPETKLDVQVSAILDGIRVSGPALPSVQIVSTGDNSSHAIIGNNQGQLTIAADMTQVGGAASAPVVAAAFHPSLATVGVLLAVFGYVVGTYGAMLCTYLMEYHSNI